MITEEGLLELKRRIEDHYRERLKAVNLMLEMWNDLQKPRDKRLQAVPDLAKTPRVRGVLAAVKALIPELPEVFDRNDILQMLNEQNPQLAFRVTLGGLRSALRSLAKEGLIELRSEANKKNPARYGVKRAA